MFTGIIQAMGRIQQAEHLATGSRLGIELEFASDLTLGESVAIDGVCLTVVSVEPHSKRVNFEVCPETLRITALGALKVGDRVHAERALRVGDRLSGHWVQGHADGMATVTDVRDEGASKTVTFELPRSLASFVVAKGSIALNGVSLTLHEVSELTAHPFLIRVQLIPHTLGCTTLGTLRPGMRLNVEVDVLAKFAARQFLNSKGSSYGASVSVPV